MTKLNTDAIRDKATDPSPSVALVGSATVVALCDALDEAWGVIDNLHQVAKSSGARCDEEWRRANRLAAENERLRNFIVDFSEAKFDRIDCRAPDPQDDLDPLTDYLAVEAWQDDARVALAQKGGA